MAGSRACRCDSEGCRVRLRRGLAPFCEMPTPAATPEPPNVFSSYERAGEHRQELPDPDRYKIVSITRSGGPKRFAVVPK